MERRAAELRRALARDPARAGRLLQAATRVFLGAAGEAGGVTLALDGDEAAVVADRAAPEVEVELDLSDLDALVSGDLSLQAAIVGGSAGYRGPVRKLLGVAPVLGALLGAPRGIDASASAWPGRRAQPVKHDHAEYWAIECLGLHKRFGSDDVLQGVDVAIPEGMITVVLGPSGTGKSVLLKHLIGLLKPDAGEVRVRGRSMAAMTLPELLDLRRKFGVLFQDGALWGSMDVYDNVALPLRQHTDLTEGEIADVVRRQLGQVGLREAEHRMPSELSGGMRKRAGFARALVLDPETVLFDEPDSGLDPVRTSLLCDLILEMHSQLGGTYIVVTHDIRAARKIADYVAVLWEGMIVESGLSGAVFNSADPFVRQFLAGDTVGPLGME